MISSNPYHPLQPTAGITHTWMGESWMVDGEGSVMMMAMISSNSPSQQGARTEFLVRIGVSGGGGEHNSLWKNVEPPSIFRSGALCMRKEGSRRWPRRPHHPQARLRVARVARWCGPLVARLRLIFWLRESSGKI
jgi:hypothetical protein